MRDKLGRFVKRNKCGLKKGHKLWLGKKHKKESCLKIKKAQIGNGNSNWKGGVTESKEHRNRIRRERDHQLNPYKKYKFRGLKPQTKQEKARYRNHNRRKSMIEAGKLTIQTIQQVYEENIKCFGTLTCIYCLNPISFGKDHLEHKTPLSRGGTNLYENLTVACEKCNRKKHDKTEKEYRALLGNGKR